MAGGLGSLVFDVGANTVTLSADLKTAEALVRKSVADINVALGKVGAGASVSGMSGQVKGLIGDFESLKGVIASVAGVSLGVGAIKQVMDLADEYQNVSNRIQTTVSSAQQLVDIQKAVFGIAQDTGNQLDETAKMYQRLEQSIASTGRTQSEAQKEALALTRTLNQEIVVSGASAGEASRSILDLVHGLSGGVLHAQQLRPIMRQMPDLAHQIAEGLGLSAHQFEEMVHKGLQADDVLKALARQSVSIEERFNALPKTFGRVWTELHNAVEQYVGQASQASSVSNLVKEAIHGIAVNIDTFATGVQAVALAMTAWLGGKTLAALGSMAVGLKDAALAQGQYKAATVLSAEADLAAAAATREALAIEIARTDAKNDLRVAELAGLNAKTAALAKEIAGLEMEAVASNNVIAANERLIVARQELATVTARVAVTEDAMAASQAKAVLAENAETAATLRLAESKVALTTATAQAASATAILGRAGASAFALIGGWPTVILAAAAGLVYLVSQETAAEEEMGKLDKMTEQVIAQQALLTPALVGSAEGLLKQAQEMEKVSRATANMYEQQAKTLQQSDASTTSYAAAADAAAYYGAEADKLAEKAGRLAKALMFANVAAGVNGTALADFTDGIRGALTELESSTEAIEKQTAAMEKRVATFKKGHAAEAIYDRDLELNKIATNLTAEQHQFLTDKINAHYEPLIKAGQAYDKLTASFKGGQVAAREAVKEKTALAAAEERWSNDTTKLADMQEQLASGLRGPYLTALKQYQSGIDFVKKSLEDAIEAHKDTEEEVARLEQIEKDLGEAYRETTKQIREQHDDMAAAAQDLQSLSAVLSAAPRQQEALSTALGKYTEKMKSHYDFYGNYIQDEEKLKQALDDQLPLYTEAVQKIHDLTEAQKLNEEKTKGWVSIWENAANSIADSLGQAIVEGKGFMDSLADTAKQVVAQIISYFAKLAVINPMLNAIFGQTAGWQQLASFGGGGGGGGGLFNAALSAFTGASGGGANSGWDIASIAAASGYGGSGTGSSGLDAYNLYGSTGTGGAAWTAGKSLFGGFESAFSSSSTASSNMFGAYTPDYGAGTYAPTGLGYGVAIAGGLYAGYNRYQQSDGGVAGIAGAAAYGYGTYAATIGVGAAATGGIAAGVAAIPVIGWIALAAMLIDKFSGGKLFGTKGKVEGGTTNLYIGEGGAEYTNVLALKGQKPLFGGAKWSTEVQAQTAEQEKAAKEFFEQMNKSMEQYAKAFGEEAGDLLDASFGQVFDKHGNLTGQTLATIGGKEYKDITAEQFAGGYLAANEIEFLSQFDDKLKETINTYTDGIDSLISVAAGLTNAQAAFQSGAEFLALGKDQTLSALVEVATGMQAAGEAIGDTINRLIQAQAQYDQFVAQFKPATVYVDDFEHALSDINAGLIANIKAANDLAIAAGAAGASEKDLANIHAYAATQAAQALIGLEASAQSLAFSMGLSIQGSLSDVTAEIQRLQGKADAGNNAVHGLGSGISDMAQRAKAAMDLLLGDLSPLNDQQKLQQALQGLRGGTVSQEQVLQIGRRLYASSQAYVDLFNQVRALGGRGAGAGVGGGGGGAAAGAGGGGLSSEERERLKLLLEEQTQLQAAQDLQNANTLATQIAEIAAAKGEDFRQVAEEMGIDLAALEKKLSLSDDQFAQWIADQQARQDENGQNTTSLIDAIYAIGDQIAEAVLGHSTHPNAGADTTTQTPAENSPRGHSGHSLGREIAAGINSAIMARSRRGGRGASS